MNQLNPMRSFYNRGSITHWCFLEYFDSDRFISSQLLPSNGSLPIPPGRQILDIGGPDSPGRGKILEFNGGGEYFGIDISPTSHGTIWDGRIIPFKDSSFDFVLVTWMIHYVDNPVQLLVEVARVLKPNGKVLIVAPIISPISGSIDEYREGFTSDLWRFTLPGIRRILPNELTPVVEKSFGGLGSLLAWPLHAYWLKGIRNSRMAIKIPALLGLPLFAVISVLVNGIGLLINYLDRSNMFTSAIGLVAKKATK